MRLLLRIGRGPRRVRIIAAYRLIGHDPTETFMRSTTRIVPWFIVAILGVAFALGGCGKDKTSGDAGTASDGNGTGGAASGTGGRGTGGKAWTLQGASRACQSRSSCWVSASRY